MDDKELFAGTVRGGFGLVAPPTGPLKGRFKMPPFSTWNTRDGEWQARRQAWLARGIKSEEGRKGNLTYDLPDTLADGSKVAKMAGTSIFDPVVCELAYRWWSPPGGVVLDPFAGGSVRGIVASLLGRKYWGCELRAEQVEANVAQLGPSTLGRYRPKWRQGDSLVVVPGQAPAADFLFSCPPYGDLEVYSDDPADISNRGYGGFLEAYNAIIAAAVAKLRPDRFAVWVVGNYRDKACPHGRYHDLVGDTVRAFGAAGAYLYNDITLINAVGTGAARANRTMQATRKVVKLHQNVLVFCNGDPRKAAKLIPMGDQNDEEK